MDSVADIDGMPFHVEGHPGSDCYYRREGITDVKPLAISDGPTFTDEDRQVILAWLKRLRDVVAEVEVWAIKIRKLHDFYTRYPTQVKSIRTVLEKRIVWLEGKL